MGLVNIIKKLIIIFILLSSNVCANIIVRDAETEEFIDLVFNNLAAKAGLDGKEIHKYLIKDKQINAFVLNSNNMFINLGLITESKDSSSVAGVLAHELGHIVGGHVAKKQDLLNKLKKEMIYSYAAGAISSIIAGPLAGISTMIMGQEYLYKNFLTYNRSQEEIADIYAARIMSDNKWPLGGLIGILEFINQKENMNFNKISVYSRSHPLNRERIGALKDRYNLKKFNMPSNIEQQFQQVKAKLIAYTESLGNLEKIIKNNKKNDDNKDYLEAIYNYRKGNLAGSVKILNKLILKNPNNPYYYELIGQINHEQKDFVNAIVNLKNAHNFNKTNYLILYEYANVRLDAFKENQYSNIKDIINDLKYIAIMEKENALVRRKLAIAFNLDGQKEFAQYALIEEALINDEFDRALKMIVALEQKIDHSSELYKNIMFLKDNITKYKAKMPKNYNKNR